MASYKNLIVAGLTAATIAGSSFAAPAFAESGGGGVDVRRLDGAPAEYSQWRRSNGRAAAVAGVAALGVLGAAAIAANRPAYAEPVYDYGPSYGYGYEPGYAYGSYAPVYEEPVEVYRPSRQRYYGGRGPYADTYRGAPDPARGGK